MPRRRTALREGSAIAPEPATRTRAGASITSRIRPAVAVAMLLPITGKVDITASMIFFSGIYYGAMYGGSTTSILLNTPGETATIVTALEGNRMARSGRGGAALATSATG